jgi:malate dehydrogenase
VILHLLDLPNMEEVLKGVQAELHDCAFPLLDEVVITSNQSVAFKDADYNFLIGSKPRSKGMERADLIKDNGKIFIDTGKAINDNASRNVKTIVVGNPANTNCLICQHYAPDIPKENFTAMTRLDHNRALTQIALRTNSKVTDIKNLSVWGNHSPTMYPDVRYATINGKKVTDMVDAKWINDEFTPRVQQRGAEIINLRKLSSAASAGSAAIDHMRDWVNGTNGEWVSMSYLSDGKQYGIPKGLIFSAPVICADGKYTLVEGLNLDDETSQMRLKKTIEELISERQAVENLLK